MWYLLSQTAVRCVENGSFSWGALCLITVGLVLRIDGFLEKHKRQNRFMGDVVSVESHLIITDKTDFDWDCYGRFYVVEIIFCVKFLTFLTRILLHLLIISYA